MTALGDPIERWWAVSGPTASRIGLRHAGDDLAQYAKELDEETKQLRREVAQLKTARSELLAAIAA